ncbi:STK_08120 family protein [Sulfolobus tengchongensis]|uniref:STK_08120 family protein n=1 Tax=Sulfolobus tengchongensis TaxID=207809 RepID=A0AAX4L2U5_9CREN
MEITLNTQHDNSALLNILSDPNFTLYKVLGAETVIVKEGEFDVMISLGITSLILHGTVYIGSNRISYRFYAVGTQKGEGGILEFDLTQKGVVKIIMEYEGRLGSFIKLSLRRKIERNIKKLDEEIRLERIKRKI